MDGWPNGWTGVYELKIRLNSASVQVEVEVELKFKLKLKLGNIDFKALVGYIIKTLTQPQLNITLGPGTLFRQQAKTLRAQAKTYCNVS